MTMAGGRTIFAHVGLWTAMLAVFHCVVILSINQTDAPCRIQRGSTLPSAQPASLKALLFRKRHDKGNCNSSDKSCECIRPSHKWTTASKRRQNEQAKLPKCRCPCRLLDRLNAGRYTPRNCHMTWKWGHFFFPSVAQGCSLVPQEHTTSHSGRRCQRLWSGSRIVDFTSNAKGQRHQLRCVDRHKVFHKQAENKLRGKKGTKHPLDLLLETERQKREGRDGDNRYVLCYILVSLAALCWLCLLLVPEVTHERKMMLCVRRANPFPLLLELLFVTGNEKPIRTVEKRLSVWFCHAGFSHKSVNSYPPMYKISLLDHSRFAGPNFSDSISEEKYSWCFKTTMSRFTSLWVAPATFLPNMMSHDRSSALNHLGSRLASLAGLPGSFSVSRVRLAEAGFYYNPTANPSAVLCHRCGVAYNLQQPPEGAPAPMDFHQSASPSCPFIREWAESSSVPSSASSSSSASASAAASLSSPRELSEDSAARPMVSRNVFSEHVVHSTGYTLALPYTGVNQRTEPLSLRTHDPLSSTETAQHTEQDVPGGHTGLMYNQSRLSLDQAVYPQYSTSTSRLSTFPNWPLPNVFPPESLVQLGFYYAGYADCVRCFFCGVGLKTWDVSDDPLKEHIRWRPHCGFLLATKGRQCVQRLLRSINGTSEDQGAGGDASENLSVQTNNTREQHGQPNAQQQLVTMGFPLLTIRRALTIIDTPELPENMDPLLDALFPHGTE